jgi:hypothetical protein
MIDWIRLHSLEILALGSTFGLVLGIIGPMLPPGRARNGVLALAHVLPGDVAQALQKLTQGDA